MMEWLETLDQKLFLFLNGIHGPFWDIIMVWISAKSTWIPLYVALIYPLWKLYGWKLVYVLLCVGLLITCSDQISVLFKDTVARYRPCHNLILQDVLHTVNGKCGGKFGFVSSHASNSFALAFFLFFQFKKRWKWLANSLMVWAVVVAYSRVYLGVHYPADIFAGAMLGCGLALVFHYTFAKKWLNRYIRLQDE
jgi:undecaprenyl-diphosphatase